MCTVSLPVIGTRAKFFHPRTFGVMHWGIVVGYNRTKTRVRVKFDVCGKTYYTLPDSI